MIKTDYCRLFMYISRLVGNVYPHLDPLCSVKCFNIKRRFTEIDKLSRIYLIKAEHELELGSWTIWNTSSSIKYPTIELGFF